ncbi:MAG TPA: hypothetical protein VJV75_08120 [Candidatus Polarisedimenticolia bacterium]|nr:hypothetical protein [Candidatus Polarisedimenticolia bacterium]
MRTIRPTLGTALALLSLIAPLRADTPDWVNYQGVLRDATGAPRSGNADMTFRFFDASSGGSEILVDRHLASGTGAVVVSGGLLSVALGSGAVSDGSAVLPGDPYTSLAAMFASFPDVWMQVEIALGGPAEVLSPRVLVEAIPYAHQAANADQADQALNANFANVAGSATTADTATLATNATQLGGVAASGYLNTSPTSQTKSGALTVNGALVAAGNNLTFGFPGSALLAGDTNLTVYGGDLATDDLILRANSAAGPNAGSISINGQAGMYLFAGDGTFSFNNAATGAQLASLGSNGDFFAGHDFVANLGEYRFGFPGAGLSAVSTRVTLQGGDLSTDDVALQATNNTGDGSLSILGDSFFQLVSGDGHFIFRDGSASLDTAELQPDGDFFVEGDVTANGNDYFFNWPGARLTASPSSLELLAGDADTDSLLLRAGDEWSDGAIDIFGSGAMNLRAGSGSFSFLNSTINLVAQMNAVGRFTAYEDLVALGSEVHLGTPGSTRIVRNPATDDFYIARDEDQNNTASTFTIFTNIGVAQMRINDGDEAPAFFDGAVNVNGIDYAEAFWISDPSLEPGDVVVFDPDRPAFIARATEAYSNRLAGVISTRPGFVTGSSFDAEEAADPALAAEMRRAFEAREYGAGTEIATVLAERRKEQQRPVALAGRLPVKVDATYGPIAAGDHLTSSPTPGYAMAMREAGPSIGIALEAFKGKGTGTILAFVQRGHYTPSAVIKETQEAQARLANTVAKRTPEPLTGVQVMPTNLQLVLDAAADEEARFSVFRDGEAKSPRAEVFRVDEQGNVWAQGAFRPRSMDLAETFRVSAPVTPGDVLALDRDHPGRYARSRTAGDPAVVGVVAADPGILLGGDVSRVLGEAPELAEALADARASGDRAREQSVWKEMERRFQAAHAAVALSGTVMVKVDAAYGAIAAGDLLTASPTEGHAMRAATPATEGTVIGKALEPLARGTGTVRMLVMLR